MVIARACLGEIPPTSCICGSRWTDYSEYSSPQGMPYSLATAKDGGWDVHSQSLTAQRAVTPLTTWSLRQRATITVCTVHPQSPRQPLPAPHFDTPHSTAHCLVTKDIISHRFDDHPPFFLRPDSSCARSYSPSTERSIIQSKSSRHLAQVETTASP
jgi:hypothetical protein